MHPHGFDKFVWVFHFADIADAFRFNDADRAGAKHGKRGAAMPAAAGHETRAKDPFPQTGARCLLGQP